MKNPKDGVVVARYDLELVVRDYPMVHPGEDPVLRDFWCDNEAI